MGAAEPELQAAGQSTAETLLSSLRTIADPERSKHASVLDYWLSIRGDKEFPPLHDLDPLEISDAGPQSILFELIGGGQDADIRHLGDGLQSHVAVQRLIDAPSPSLLSSIARKLPIVAISRDFLAFEETFSTAAGLTRCWVTLLPLSSCGSWVDYVYAFVTVETSGLGSSAPVAEPAPADPAATTMDEAQAGNADAGVEQAEPEAAAIAAAPETPNQAEDPAAAPDEEKHLGAAIDRQTDLHEPAIGEPAADPETKAGPGFSRLIEGIASLAGFYGQGVKAPDEVSIGHPSPGAEQAEDPDSEAGQPAPSAGEVPLDQVDEAIKRVEPGVEPAEASGDGDKPDADELLASGPIEPDAAPPAENPPGAMVAREAVVAEATAANPASDETSPPGEEGKLQNKLTEVRARADEAREAQARATRVLHEGLSAAYDFALDAETSPEEYLRLVEAEGMKIQLRAPMAPVASLAFNGLCDEPTIRQFEAVLAWALKQELPRGALIERIEQAGGITELLNGA